MKPKVYLETSIFSFYYDERQSPLIVGQREVTREWWDLWRESYDCWTATPVLVELDRGTLPHRHDAFALAATVPRLVPDAQAERLVQTYIDRKLMPNDPGGDAMHLALASLADCEFLLTWNCQHLANANKLPHLEHINRMRGVAVPRLVTPQQLWGPPL
ncbi:MAG: hypothetical protein ABIZ56_12490 [Chthoniobacteraceae bacterium]